MAGDARDGRDDPPRRRRSSTPARSPRSARSRSGRRTTRAPSTRGPPSSPSELLAEVLAAPTLRAAARGRRDVRGEDRPGRPRARLARAAGGEPEPRSARSRRTSARARSSTGGRSRSGARASTTASSSRSRCSPRGGGGWATTSSCAACGEISPARRAAFEVVRRVFEDGRVRRPGAAQRGRAGSTRATARSRSGSRTARSSASARSTTRSRRSAGGRCASSTRPCGRRCGSARTSSRWVEGVAAHAAVERVGRARPRGARLERAVPFTNAVMRRLAEGIAALLAALPEATPAEAALKHSYPDWVADDVVARARAATRRGR